MQEITLADPFGQALAKYSTGLECGVEIGGGTGDGSTQCIKTKELFSFEIHPDRIGRHGMNLSMRQGGTALHHLSSNPARWMNETQIKEFYQATKTNLNAYPIEQILGWLKDDLANASKHKWGTTYLAYKPDFILLDGGAFSGEADMAEWFPRLRDGGIIALDDVNDIKNHANYSWLKDNGHALLWQELSWRNGSAVFRK